MFGKVACQVWSKILGIGPVEHSWSVVKHLKTNKRAPLSCWRAEKQVILYSTARIEESRAKRGTNDHLKGSLKMVYCGTLD